MKTELDQLAQVAVQAAMSGVPSLEHVRRQARQRRHRRLALRTVLVVPALLLAGTAAFAVLNDSDSPQIVAAGDEGQGSSSSSTQPAPLVEVPDLLGLAASVGTDILVASGFSVEILVDEDAPSMPDGLIIASDPPAGSRVSVGEIVVLTVSTADPQPTTTLVKPSESTTSATTSTVEVTPTTVVPTTTVVDVDLVECFEENVEFPWTIDAVDFFFEDWAFSLVDATAIANSDFQRDVADFDGDGRLDTLQHIYVEDRNDSDVIFRIYRVCGVSMPLPLFMLYRPNASVQTITESREEFEWTSDGPGLVWTQTGGNGWAVIPIMLVDGAWQAGDRISASCNIDGCTFTTVPDRGP